MKKILVILCLLFVFSSGVLYFQKTNQARQEQARATQAEQKLREAEANAARQEEQNQILQGKLRATDSEVSAKASEVHELKQQLASTPNSIKKREPGPGAKLFKDPEMKETMKKQQMADLERKINKIVNADLIKQFGLNGEQAAYLKDLLKKKHGPGAEIAIELMARELSDAQMAELGKQFKQQMVEADGQIKAYLGEDAYKTFEWQEKSQEERSRLKDYQQKVSELGQPLTPEQRDGLLRVMYEERQNFKFQVDYSDPLTYDYEHLREFFGEDNLNRYYHDMEQLNERTLQRAQSLLTPEQSAQLKASQREQLERGRMVVRMTSALFDGK